MINIKQLIKDFNIDNKEDLANLFLYTYEYYFTIKEILPNANEAIELKDNFLRELSKIEDLERLWCGLYLKFTLYYNKDSNTKMLNNSIKKTIKQLPSIDINFLRKQISEINELADNDILGIKERPIMAIKYSNDNIFIEISKFKDIIIDFITKNDKIFSKKSCNAFDIINDKAISQYRKKEEVFLELWAVSVQGRVMEEILKNIDVNEDTDELSMDAVSSIIENITTEEAENLTIEEINEILGTDLGADYTSNIDVPDGITADFIESIALDITDYFVQTVTQSKKAQNTLRTFINPVNKQIVYNIFFDKE